MTINKYGKLSHPPLNTSLEKLLVYTSPANRYNLIYELDRTTAITVRPVSPEHFPFTKLPAELQTEVLSYIPHTSREVAMVSKGMKQITDRLLLENIRKNNLVDPIIGIVDRTKYFKTDIDGEYFDKEPGLWREFNFIKRTNLDRQVVLIYGELLRSDIEPLPLIIPPGFERTRRTIQKLETEQNESNKLLLESTFPERIKFVSLAEYQKFDQDGNAIVRSILVNKDLNLIGNSIFKLSYATELPLERTYIKHQSGMDIPITEISTSDITYRIDVITNPILSSITREPLKLPNVKITIKGTMHIDTNTSTVIERASSYARAVTIDKTIIDDSTVIFPSLQDDVYII